jgi:DNA-binding MarR family transcriptional regulator
MPETHTTAMPPSMTTMLGILSDEHGATVVELANRGHLGRSTAAKVLTALEAQGLARRQSAERTGTRAPDLWFAAAHTAAQAHDETTHREPSATSGTASEPTTTTAQHGTARNEETGQTDGDSPQSKAPADDEAEPDPADTSTPDTAESAGSTDTAHPADRADNATATGAAAPEDGATPSTAPQPVPTATTAHPRLAKGGLRALVVDYLAAHPHEEMTASAIGKSLGRSSGAVANALDTLVKSDQAELTCEKPRKFRHRAPQTGN